MTPLPEDPTLTAKMPSKTRTSKKRRSKKRTPTPPPRPKAKAIAKNAFHALVSAVRKDVDARLGGLFDAKLDSVRELGPEAVELVTAMRDLCLRGGKRTRAALVVAGYRAASIQAPLEPALDAGVAVELLHAYFLIHDDWMDDDNVRRGGPAVHAALSQRFRSRRLGERSGILAGDLAQSYASECLARVEVAPARLARVFACFAQMQTDAVLGQQLDVLGRTRNVEKVYELKTGSYTVRGPLRLGALLAGGSPRLLTTLDRFALPVGIAFQLRDDLLGVFGDPRSTGKPVASDLTSGKRTVLLTTGLRRARGRDHRLLASVAGNAKAKTSDLRKAIDVLERCGARGIVEERIDELVSAALAALRAGRLPPEAASLLEGASRALTSRVG